MGRAKLVESSRDQLGDRGRSEDALCHKLRKETFLLRIEPDDNLHGPHSPRFTPLCGRATEETCAAS